MVAAVGVQAVEHLFAMVGNIHHNGILVAETAAEQCHNLVVVERCIVVVGDNLPFAPAQVAAPGIVACGKVHVARTETPGIFLVLPHAVENHEVETVAGEFVELLKERCVVGFAVAVAEIEAKPRKFAVVQKEAAVEVNDAQVGALVILARDERHLVAGLAHHSGKKGAVGPRTAASRSVG